MTATDSDALPAWFDSLRDHQRAAISEIVDAFHSGVQVVTLDAPTGSGKTLIGEMVRRELDTRAVYTCTTKSLQDQVLRDYPYARVLKGRANYTPIISVHGDVELTCADCNKAKYDNTWCDWCEETSNCPYERAKHGALSADLAVLNTSYLLTEANGPGRFKDLPLVIVDECDLAESELMRYVGVEVTPRRVKELGLGVPRQVTKEDAWVEWIGNAIGVLKNRPVFGEGVQAEREKVRRGRLLAKFRQLMVEIPKGQWVYTGNDSYVAFKPVTVRAMGPQMLWRHSARWLLMSATVISPRVMLEDELGWDDRWQNVECEMTFPVENRPVFVCSVADMSKKGIEGGSTDALVLALESVLSRHPTERVLVHCVSYPLGRSLVGALRATGRAVHFYESARDRDATLDEFRRDEASVLVAPSFDRGVDLPDDLCRVVVVAKLPFPYLGDRQVSARLHSYGGQQWYDTQTARSLVQMTGRHVRHKDDWGVSYILDTCFDSFYPKARRSGLLPMWWVDALRWENPLDVVA